ncbi:putative ribonuclease H-like domain-containing protein, partial [Tanacetum coccineum]
ARKKEDEGVSKESGNDDQERPKNSTQDVNTAGPSINTEPHMFSLGDNATLKDTHADFFGDETGVNMSNITTTYLVPSTLNTRIHKNHSLDHVIGDVHSDTEHNNVTPYSDSKDLFLDLTSLRHNIENINKLTPNVVSHLRHDKNTYRSNSTSTSNRRIEAIGLFLAYASFMGFMVYQMDVKSAFLYGRIEEEVYVCQPLGFEDPDYPDKVYKVVKALYGLHQALRAWYETLAKYLLDNGFHRGKMDQTLFIKKQIRDIFLISSMGELTFFLGLQVNQKEDEIFISQDKYVAGILRKFSFTDVSTTSTLMYTKKPLLKDSDGDDVDVHLYKLMIGSLMYLTSSIPDIMYLKGQPKLGLWYPRDSSFNLVAYSDSDYAGASLDRKSTIGGCQFLGCILISWQWKKQTVVATSSTKAEYVATASYCGQDKQSSMVGFGDTNWKSRDLVTGHAVVDSGCSSHIHQPKLGLWYPRDSPFKLEAFSDSDYARASLDKKSTTEYVAAAHCCGQNLVYHSRTKHIEIRHHFIRDCYKKKLIDVLKIHTDSNVADLLTKGFDVTRFNFLVISMDLRMDRCSPGKYYSSMVFNSGSLQVNSGRLLVNSVDFKLILMTVGAGER